MEFTDPDELKEFILWCKEQKIGAMKVGSIEFQFTNLAFVEEYNSETYDDSPDLSTPPVAKHIPEDNLDELMEGYSKYMSEFKGI